MTIVALMALSVQLGGEYRPFRIAEAPDAVYAVLVGPTNRPELEKKILAIIQEPAVAVARISVFRTREMAIRGSVGIGDDALYGNWATYRKKVKVPCLQVLEMMKIGSNVVARQVDDACQITERTLHGRNPRLLEIAGTRYEILNFLMQSPPADWPARGPTVSWYVVTEGSVDVKSARIVFDHLRKLTSARNVSVGLRKDPWFLTDSEFPVFYPFDLRDPPTEPQYLESPEATCGILSDSPATRPGSCWMNRHPRRR